MGQMKGKASIEFEHPPVIISAGSVVGKKEGEGPLGSLFDEVELDDMFGMDNWEQAESTMQKKTADLVIEKGGIRKGDLRYLFAGDLLGQLIATSFGTVDLEIPLFGLYGACSTMGEALGLGAMAVNAGYADQVMSMASSHFAHCGKTVRFSAGLWEPAAALCHMDCNGLRRRGSGRKQEGWYGPHRRHHNGTHGGHGRQGFHEYGSSHGSGSIPHH